MEKNFEGGEESLLLRRSRLLSEFDAGSTKVPI